ncbi:EAL domain-containing protein [Telluria mixta]|uniref:EAL domain-containing protein n=1 Tax=Telluria mixta TaxID=34071 RepID=A0ABT2BXZ7_9BURK|nr:EAL domain-containing protein [Telluria mixta]MCS0629990.1 EAL domain-containing protein [Telluria mixta]WEM96457.1 EAL domain-containing protein [Telluria mixta]
MQNCSPEEVRSLLDKIEQLPVPFFKRLIEASNTGIIISDASLPDNPIAYVNPAFERMTGYALYEVVGRNCRFLQRDDRDQPEIALIRHCVENAEVCTALLRNYRKDGSPFWSRMHLFPVHENGSAPTHFVAFLQDVTEVVEAQQAAVQARERLSTVLESISDGCVSLDREWRFTYVNARGAAWIDRAPEDLIGKNMWDEFPEAVGGPFYEAYQHAMHDREVARCENFYAPLGIWLELRVYPSREGVTAFFADVTERKEAETRLLHMATHDSMTGLHNRFSCLRALDEALARSVEDERPVGVLFVDLDHFKEVNDAHGHRAGDNALQEIGRRLGSLAGAGITVARISGDEFVVVLEGMDTEGAKGVAAAVLQHLATPIPVDGHYVSVGGSIGIAIGTGRDYSADELLNNADAAMYEAKDNGRHTFAVFSTTARHLLKQRLELRQDVFSALERRQFVLFYQPQVSAANGAVVGAEALLRWEHPRLGLLAPDLFLPMLEGSPAITAVGAWVCEEACRQAREWELLGYRLRMAVNVSPRQLMDENLPPLLTNIVTHYDLDPECIKLEVTESMLMQDIDKAAAVLRLLQRDGFRIALDDFGTGYSNLSYLRTLPITAIKIDRSFVREIEQDRRCLDIVNGVIAFAKSLKLDVICEGIETELQKEAIRSTGCDVLQGYLIGKPMRAEDFRALLLAQKAEPTQADPGCQPTP